MSRHRNVRSMNYEDEYYDEDDVYGHSIEDNYCISPGTAAQFTFNRDHNVALSNFMDKQGGIPEEDEEGDTDEGTPRDQHRSSLDYTRPKLTDIDEAKLNSVLEEVRNVLGEAVPEGVMVDTILRRNFSVEGTLNELLNQQDAPKPQRQPRRDRRNRSQEVDDEIDSDNDDSLQDNVFSYIPDFSGGVLKFGDSVSPKSPSFLMKSKDVSVNNKSGSVIVTRQCAFVSNPVNVANITASEGINGQAVDNNLPGTKKIGLFSHDTQPNSQDQMSILKSNTGKFSHDTQSSSQSSDQVKEKSSKPESRFTVDMKQSLSALAKEHGIANKEGIPKLPSSTKVSVHSVRNGDTKVKGQIIPAVNLENSHTELAVENRQEDKVSLIQKDFGDSVVPMTSKSLSLSDLANQNKGSVGKSMQQMVKTNGPSLEDMAQSHSAATSNTQVPQIKKSLNLSDLAKEHSKNTGSAAKNSSSVPLSILARDHTPSAIPTAALPETNFTPVVTTSQTKSSPSLSGLAAGNLNSYNDSSGAANKSSSLLSNLATAHLHNAQSPSSLMPGLGTGFKPSSAVSKPLASSAPLSVASSPSSALSKSPSGSCSGKSPVGMSLSQLAEAHGVKKSLLPNVVKEGTNISDNKENQDTGKRSVSLLSSEIFKNKSDKEQIILSLSNLVEKHGKKESGVIVTRQYASSRCNGDNTQGDNFTHKGKENADLGNSTENCPVRTTTMSLADLAKARNPQVLKDMKLKTNVGTENVIQVSKAVDKDESTEKENDVPIDENKDSLDFVGVLEETLKLTDDLQFEAIKYLVRAPSTIGNTFCLGVRVRKGKKYKTKRFSYSYQLKGVKEKMQAELSQIKPFDFSTPSPDDVVKAKQKQAFNRSGK